MGVADSIRAGQLAKYEAFEAAGINDHIVSFSLAQSIIGAKPQLGKEGTRTEIIYSLKPNPSVTIRRQEGLTQFGTPIQSDLILEGAFPEQLTGTQYINGGITPTVSTKTYASPAQFREDLEKADYFIVDGEKYQYSQNPGSGGGFVQVDNYQSKWKLKLVRTNKQ